jgi:hypothetical protein
MRPQTPVRVGGPRADERPVELGAERKPASGSAAEMMLDRLWAEEQGCGDLLVDMPFAACRATRVSLEVSGSVGCDSAGARLGPVAASSSGTSDEHR